LKLPSEKEFKVNEYITLKLEGGNTNIYVNGKLFQQCKLLLLNIPVEKVSSFDEIESIDEATEKLDYSLERNSNWINIPQETEFWGHCSNLQVWIENNYDTRLLHRTIAFPLLKKLTKVGDPNARRIFKEEICKRFESRNFVVIQYLLEENYLRFLNNEEKIPLFTDILNTLDKIANDRMKRKAFTILISTIKGTKLLEENFPDILNTLDKISNDSEKRYAFSELISAIKGTELMNTKHSLIETKFTDILNTINKIYDDIYKRQELNNLISTIKGTEVIDEKLTLIRERFPELWDELKFLMN